MRSKLAWVRRKLGARDALAQLPPHRYEAGERFPYLGREHELVDRRRRIPGRPGRRRAALDGRAELALGPQLTFDLVGEGDDSRGSERRLSDDTPACGRRRRRRRCACACATGASSSPARRDAGPAGCSRSWYRRHAADVLHGRVAHFAPLVGVALPPIAVKDMRSRWGSCSARGNVSLHWGLVLLDPELLDYVVVHELVHLRRAHHQPAFWRGVERLLPDYRERRRRLRGESARSVI